MITHIILLLSYRLYLDAQLGGIVTSLIRRGSPLNFILNPVGDCEADTELYEREAGEWRLIITTGTSSPLFTYRLMFHRQCQWSDYLGQKDDESYYAGTSHRVSLSRVEEASFV